MQPISRPARMTLAAMCAVVLACASRPAARGPVATAPAVDVRFISDEADAALAILALRREGQSIPDSLWQRVWSSAGYRTLWRREKAMGREFTDSQFRAFLLSDTLAARSTSLARTLQEWKDADVTGAARRAAAYLPAPARLRARLYPLIKPVTNTFVFDVGTDSAAIMLYVDPTVTREVLESTLGHELHHIGYAALCAASADTTLPEPQQTAVGWLGAFGEGVAVLASAGSPDVHPHAASDSAERAQWERDYANIGSDLRRVEGFLLDILAGRESDPARIRQRAMSFFGPVQGPWYTVGYAMASTVERSYGRDVLVGSLCDWRQLLRRYNEAAAEHNATVPPASHLPLWSAELLEQLTG